LGIYTYFQPGGNFGHFNFSQSSPQQLASSENNRTHRPNADIEFQSKPAWAHFSMSHARLTILCPPNSAMLFSHFRCTLDFSPLQMHNSQMSDENTQRIEKLESHVAHLEHQVEQLNDVVVEQGKLLDKLRKEVQRLSGSLQTMELERVRSNVQKPPHYQ
jgi:SlyX protein